MTQLLFGDVSAASTPATVYAHATNLDGLHFVDRATPGHCITAKTCTILDGPGGRDNAFGVHVLPIFLGFFPDFPDYTAKSVQEGRLALALRIRHLGPGRTYNGLSAEALPVRGEMGGDGFLPVMTMSSYAWHPLPDQLAVSGGSGDDLVAKSSSTNAYAVDNFLVIDDLGVVELPLAATGVTLYVPIHNARITGRLSADHAAIDEGTIVGVIPANVLSGRVLDLAPGVHATCSSGILRNAVEEVGRAADMMLDRSQDPTATCDGISVAVGFRAEASTLGDAAPAESRPTCAK